MYVVLGFAARVDGFDHPAAIFKFSGRDGFCWSRLEPSNAHLINIWPTNKRFIGMTEYHSSYHYDGRKHQSVATADGREHIPFRRDLPIENITTWASLRSISIPLTASFPWEMNAKAWRAVKCPYILRSEDFNGAYGVDLHGFICRKDRIRDLICTWRVATQHWVAGDQDLQLVVLAEPLRLLEQGGSALQ